MARRNEPIWRRDEQSWAPYALKLAVAGARAIGIDQSIEPENAPREDGALENHDQSAVLSRVEARDAPDAMECVSAGPHPPRRGSKAQVIELLHRNHGATVDGLIAATGWLAQTIRAALTGLRKRGYAVAIDRSDHERGSFYRIKAEGYVGPVALTFEKLADSPSPRSASRTSPYGIDLDTAFGSDMFGEMHALFGLQRSAMREHRFRGEADAPAPITVEAVLKAATVHGARAAGLENSVGTLAPGKQADVIMVRTGGVGVFPVNNVIGTIVQAVGRADVDTVMVAGQLRKRAGKLIGVDLVKLRTEVDASRDYLLAVSGHRADLFGAAAPRPPDHRLREPNRNRRSRRQRLAGLGRQ